MSLSALSSEEGQNWNSKGTKLYDKGDYEGAIDCYNEALKYDPEAYKIWDNKGNAYYKLGNYEKACGCFNQVLKYNQEFIQAYYKKGVCLNELGKYEDAIECFDKVLLKNSNDKDAKKGREEAESKLSAHNMPVSKEGKVLVVKGESVEINVGSKDGLTKGRAGVIRMTITCNGSPVILEIGKIIVTDVNETTSYAKITKKTGNIQPGYIVVFP